MGKKKRKRKKDSKSSQNPFPRRLKCNPQEIVNFLVKSIHGTSSRDQSKSDN